MSPTLSPSKSTTSFSGIAVAGHSNSTSDLTTFKTPPSFSPVHLSSLINSTTIPTFTVDLSVTLKKSTWIVFSDTGWNCISLGRTKYFSLFTKIFNNCPYIPGFWISISQSFADREIGKAFSLLPYMTPGIIPFFLTNLADPLPTFSLKFALISFVSIIIYSFIKIISSRGANDWKINNLLS